MDFDQLLADRMRAVDASAIREILKVAARPKMISLAGGMPAPDSFPLRIFPELVDKVLTTYGHRALQYDLTEGFGPLREALAAYIGEKEGLDVSTGDVLIGSGSQGILDGLGKILISRGDSIAIEAPTYLGAIQAFAPYQPNYVSLQTGDDGVSPDALEAVLKQGRVKCVYLVPTFQNPTGRTIPISLRQKIADLLKKYHALLIEDDPYSALRYRGEAVPSIFSMAPDNVVYVGTFSKIFAPGLRIGFCISPPSIRKWLVTARQGVDLHTSTFGQALAAEYLTGGYLDRHLPHILSIYAPRQAAMFRALEDAFPPYFHWSRPEGGMFVWLRGPEGMDMTQVYARAVARNVAFVPGTFFFVRKGDGMETARLSFTCPDEKDISRAVTTLGDVIRQYEKEMSG